MKEPQCLRVQLEPADSNGAAIETVKRVADDRVADRPGVDPQLMASPRLGHEFQSGGILLETQHLPFRFGRLASVEIDFLQRPIGPIDGKRQLDPPCGRRDAPVHPCMVDLLHMPSLELQPDMPLCRPAARKNHEPRSAEIQPVDQQRLFEFRLHSGEQAIRQIRRFSRNRQKSVGLVHDQDRIVRMQDLQWRIRRPVVEFADHLALEAESSCQPLLCISLIRDAARSNWNAPPPSEYKFSGSAAAEITN